MVVNCYYPLSPYNEQHFWCANVIFEQLYSKLVNSYPNIVFKLIDSVQYSEYLGIHHHGFPGKKFGYHRMIIENTNNGKYFVVNYGDTLTCINKSNGWDIENLVEIFSSTGAHEDTVFFKRNNVEYTPSSYCCRSVNGEKFITDSVFLQSNTTQLYFRGDLYLFRKHLLHDNRFTIYNTYNDSLDEIDYLKELKNNFISLSLNGTGEICHRDIESFGTFCTVIRPELTVQFHNKLISNYHYIGVPVNDLYHLTPQQFYFQFSDRLYEKYLQIKDDTTLLRNISKNARKWYLENGTINSNVEILHSLINFDKLI